MTIFHIDTPHITRHQPGNQEIPSPGLKKIARIKLKTGGRNGRHPIFDRLFNPFITGKRRDTRACIVQTIGRNRPPVIGTGFDEVDFIPALWPVLVHIDGAVFGDEKSLWAAMSVGVNLGPHALFAHKRIIRRHRAILIKPYNRPQRVRPVLRFLTVIKAVTKGQKQCPVRRKGNAPAIMSGGRLERRGFKYHFEICQRGPVKLGTGNARCIRIRLPMRIGQVNKPICHEIRMRDDIKQTALAPTIDRWHT